MPPDKKQRLRLTRLDSVGFVDQGANPVADITLWKRHQPDQTGDDMADQNKTPDANEVAKAVLSALQKSGYAIATDSGYAIATDANDLLKQIAALLSKSGYAIATDSGYAIATDSGYAIATDRVRQPFMKRFLKALGLSDAQVEAVEKVDAQPEPMDAEVAKRMADAEKRAAEAEAVAKAATDRISALELQRRTEQAVEKARGFAHLPVKPEEFGVILRKVNDGEKLTDAERAELERALAANNEVVRTAKLFIEIGKTAAPEGSARAKVDAAAAEIRKANPKLSEQAARGQVYKQHPEWMAEVEAETSR